MQVRNAAEAHLTPAELEHARAKADEWGNGSNSIDYICKITSDESYDWFHDHLKVDLDRWSARSSQFRGPLEVTVDNDEIDIREGYGDQLSTINGSMQTCGVDYAAAAVASSLFSGRKPG